MDKEAKKFLRKKLAAMALITFPVIIAKLPLKFIYFTGEIIGKLFYLLVARHRKLALENLRMVYPRMNPGHREKIAKESFIFMVQFFLETLYFIGNPRRLDSVRIEGREYIDEVIKNNQGIIGLTAHLGNFPLMLMKLVAEGYDVNIVLRPMRDPAIGKQVQDLCAKVRVKTIFSHPRRKAVSNIIRALRNKEIVTILMDQNVDTGGVWVNFFGKLAATPIGPVIFALRTGAVILPVYIVREGIGKHCIKILPPQNLEKTDNEKETILLNVIKFTKIIETWINRYPSQWGWIQRRWKSRLPKEGKDMEFRVEKSG